MIMNVPTPGNLLLAESSKIVEKEGFLLENLIRMDQSKHFLCMVFLKEAMVQTWDNDIATVILMKSNVTLFHSNHNIVGRFI